MSDATGRWVISFNGEIYNHCALRSELESLGCVFQTSSDTEVLINVLAHWGEAGLRKLRGMYAFALWDSLHRQLWLARDPYGIKPLYVSEKRGTLWFASQACALAGCAPVDQRRDAAALTGFLSVGSRTGAIFLVGRDQHVSCRSCATDLRGTVASSATGLRSGSGRVHQANIPPGDGRRASRNDAGFGAPPFSCGREINRFFLKLLVDRLIRRWSLRTILRGLGCSFTRAAGAYLHGTLFEGSFAGWLRGSAAKGQARYC
jgi:hypothetical protein